MDIKYCKHCGGEIKREQRSRTNWARIKYCSSECNNRHRKYKKKPEIRGNMNSDTLYLNDYITKPFIQEEE